MIRLIDLGHKRCCFLDNKAELAVYVGYSGAGLVTTVDKPCDFTAATGWISSLLFGKLLTKLLLDML